MGHVSVRSEEMSRAILVFFRSRKSITKDLSFMSEDTTVKPILLNSTDVGSQEGKFSLIHIPLSLYSSLLQPILQVLLPHGGPTSSEGPEGLLEGLSID